MSVVVLCWPTVIDLSGMALSAAADCLLMRLTSSLPLIFDCCVAVATLDSGGCERQSMAAELSGGTGSAAVCSVVAQLDENEHEDNNSNGRQHRAVDNDNNSAWLDQQRGTGKMNEATRQQQSVDQRTASGVEWKER